MVIEEEVWENERWVMLKGWGSPGMMPQDLATGKRRFRHSGKGYDDFPSVSCPAGEACSMVLQWDRQPEHQQQQQQQQ